jgi:hypothetical protein
MNESNYVQYNIYENEIKLKYFRTLFRPQFLDIWSPYSDIYVYVTKIKLYASFNGECLIQVVTFRLNFNEKLV